jgi:hypothetical protein
MNTEPTIMSTESTDISHSTDETTVFFFAIGAMMNKVSLELRKVVPIQSWPAEIIDHDLGFFGSLGFAEAIPSEGKSFHGVLHKLHKSDMDMIDKIEVGYIRSPAKIRLYNGDIIHGCVYTKENLFHSSGDKPPTERYMDLLILGCVQHGVDESHIEWLKHLEVQPRRKPHEFRQIPVADGLRTWTMDEVARGHGQDGAPIYFAINGKVVEYVSPKDMSSPAYKMSRVYAGCHLELLLSRNAYEPKYGYFDNIEDFTREHAAYCEDFYVGIAAMGAVTYVAVGIIEQKYKDDEVVM